MRALIAPQDQTPYVAPETVSLIWLVAAEEEVSARLHEGTVEIPRLEIALSHLRGNAEVNSQEERRGRNYLFIYL